MASTITAATLTVTVSEDITLNGSAQGASNNFTHASIAEITKRILTITTAESTIATFSAAVASAGHYVAADVRYIRFTNLDDTNFIALTFRNQDNDECSLKLDAGQSFVWNGDNANGMTAVMNATQDADAASSTNEPWTWSSNASGTIQYVPGSSALLIVCSCALPRPSCSRGHASGYSTRPCASVAASRLIPTRCDSTAPESSAARTVKQNVPRWCTSSL